MKLNRPKTTIALMLTGAAAVCAVLLAPLTGSVGPAVAANNYTCGAFVTWKTNLGQTGINPMPPMTGVSADYVPLWKPSIPGIPVSGATITAAATACHAATRAAFQANAAWYVPANVCASQGGHADQWGRVFNGETRTVWAVDRFKEIAESPQKYNRVDSYTVTCGPTVVWDHTLAGGVSAF